ncbi:uncharacterized protein LOC129741432 [Uranotaenia lowii]|uniref:uncharacterized protein LOC129741432 n=1 Tax=Uranotaenia lowii TaxID=190385 RepID=UPI0024783F48|nr:uncharacterized protein LOC129741432 [Uranotaenia lowii]
MDDDPGDPGPFGSRFGLLAQFGDSKKDQKSIKSNKRRANGVGNSTSLFNKIVRVDQRNGPRFLIMERKDANLTMYPVNPFFIKKAMDAFSSNVTISRMRNGCLLLKTVDRQQAAKLMKMTNFGGTIKVEVTKHPTLNLISGTIYCRDLVSLSDKEILQELTSEHVVKVSRMSKKDKAGKSVDTGTFILTFDLNILPASINVGFYLCKVKPYIPSPLRCKNCLHYGHTKNHCKGNQACAMCGQMFHGSSECASLPKCINCSGDHSALSRTCPKYIDEMEIQRIRTNDRVSIGEARRRRRQQVPEIPVFTRSYAQVAQEIPTSKSPTATTQLDLTHCTKMSPHVKNISQPEVEKSQQALDKEESTIPSAG